MRILTFGTCRIYGAAEAMQGARRFPHRVHNPAEIERSIDLLQGRDHPPDLSHVLSEHALNAILSQPGGFLDVIAAPLALIRAHTFDAYVIEVSSLRTNRAASDRGPVLVDSVVSRSLLQKEDQLAPLYDTGTLRRLRDFTAGPDPTLETRDAMRRIKRRLAGPIVWVSHCGLPEPRPEEEHLALVRSRLSDRVSGYAAAQGDGFFDPAHLVARHGREAVFMQGGEDLYHYTDFGHAELARAVGEKLALLAAP